MSPQDIAVLLKIISYGKEPWLQKPLADALSLSQSEISKSITRSKYAGLLYGSGKEARKQVLLEALQFGITVVFPVHPAAIVRGIPTAHSAPPLNKIIQSDGEYVWPSAKVQIKGQAIVPLYSNAVKAVQNDQQLHEMLALVYAIRVGSVRENQIAIDELKKKLL